MSELSHQEIGRQQELFIFSDFSPGSAIFLPRGARIYNRLIEFLRREYRKRGYEEVITPNIATNELWEISGHWWKYRGNMFVLEHKDEKEETVKEEEHGPCCYAMKAMNCPLSALIYKSRTRNYRDLPMRLADFGVLHRNELKGALRGLTRVRRFQQDDAHIYCTEEQVPSEIEKSLTFVKDVYKIFSFDIFVELSTRPDEYIGSLDVWNRAETALAQILEKSGMKYTINPGEGSFYGCKVDIHIQDVIGRRHQCATIQLDYNLPERFDLTYQTNVPGELKRPVVIHRAILGSLERFIGILTEHLQGKWPLWLSPRQVCVMGVHPKHNDYAREVSDRLFAEGFDVDLETSDETLDKRVFNAQKEGYNYIVVVGNREMNDKTVSIRERGSTTSVVLPSDEFIRNLHQRVNDRN